MLVSSPLNMAHVYIIFLQLGFILPKSHTIHKSLSSPPVGYSSIHMEHALMLPVSFDDITWCSLVMLPSDFCVMLLCVQGNSQPVPTIFSSLLKFLTQPPPC